MQGLCGCCPRGTVGSTLMGTGCLHSLSQVPWFLADGRPAGCERGSNRAWLQSPSAPRNTGSPLGVFCVFSWLLSLPTAAPL